MTTGGTTLNQGGDAPATPSVASGNFDAMLPTMPEDVALPSAETLNTVEGTTDQTTEQKAEESTPKDGQTPAATKEETATTEPFHNHPRFQQLIGKNRELENQLKALSQQFEALSKDTSRTGDSTVSGDDIQAEFAKLLKQVEEGEMSLPEAMKKQSELWDQRSKLTIQQVLEEQAKEVEAQKIQEKFLQDNADFVELRDSGKLQEIMDSNPMHDPLSAYYAYKAQQVDNAVQEAVGKAVKETEERLRKEFQSKRHAASLGSGAAHVPSTGENNPVLDDTKKYGGKTTVLAGLLKKMRSDAGG